VARISQGIGNAKKAYTRSDWTGKAEIWSDTAANTQLTHQRPAPDQGRSLIYTIALLFTGKLNYENCSGRAIYIEHGEIDPSTKRPQSVHCLRRHIHSRCRRCADRPVVPCGRRHVVGSVVSRMQLSAVPNSYLLVPGSFVREARAGRQLPCYATVVRVVVANSLHVRRHPT